MKGTEGSQSGTAVLAGPRPRRARLRVVLVVLGGVIALLCLGGAGVFVVLYDEATKIERNEPDAAVDNYLRAVLTNRDNAEAALFACGGAGELPGMRGLMEEIAGRERDHGVKVIVTWSSLVVQQTAADRRAVTTDLTIAGSSGGQQRSSRIEQWSFDVVDQDGWRVCGASRIS